MPEQELSPEQIALQQFRGEEHPEAAAAQAAAHEVAPPPVQQAPPEETPEKIIEQIEKKVELGQDLTPEEQQKLDKLEKDLPVAEPDTKYRIAGQEITYADAATRMREQTGIGQVDLGREAEKNLVETWVRAQNKSEFSKRTDQAAQDVAHARQGVLEQNRQLQLREREQAQRFAKQEALIENIRDSLNDLAQQRQELQNIIAAKPREDEIIDPATGVTNLMKQADFMRARNAEFDIQRIDAREQQLKQKEEQLVQEAQQSQNYLAALEVEQFVTNVAPEFMPESTDLWTAFSKYTNGQPLDKGDWTKMHELTTIIAERDTRGADITQIYQYMKEHGQLSVKGAQTLNGRSLPTPRSRDEDLVNRLNKLKERRDAAPSRMPAGVRGTTAAPAGAKSPEQLAEEHLNSERIAETPSRVDKSVFEGKITNPQRAAGL